jgi:hypothetical protein
MDLNFLAACLYLIQFSCKRSGKMMNRKALTHQMIVLIFHWQAYPLEISQRLVSALK